MARSKVAEELRQEQMREVLAMTPDERVELIVALRDRGLEAVMAARGIDRDTAIDEIKRSRRIGRRYSRSMDD
jgi:hypothetical protein